MLKYARFIIPTSAYPLIDLPPESSSVEVEVNFDKLSQNCRLSYFNALSLLLRGKAKNWFEQNFEAGDTLVVTPQVPGDNNEFIGFVLDKPHPVTDARTVKNHIFVAVRPDWRNSKSLLGYYNPLTNIYDDTPFLRFLLRTKAHFDGNKEQALPHFVILDEMNLARVEYYFADLLSVIESGRADNGYTKEAVHLHSQDPEQTFGTRGQLIPPNIELPPNLYVIGTVNMDETTHAFSPKVLDRAFTIEFNEVDFSNYPPGSPDEITQSQKNQLQEALLTGFRRAGKFAQIDKPDVTAGVKEENYGYRDQLQRLNQALYEYDLHFGYRVFDEIAQFMLIADDGDLFDDLDEAFDLVVLMKVLPKFNGPRSRLRQPLETVVAWAKNPESGQRQDVANSLRNAEVCRELLAQLPTDYIYPETAQKAIRMLIRLHETGFASFS
jgi:hypothetical protein